MEFMVRFLGWIFWTAFVGFCFFLAYNFDASEAEKNQKRVDFQSRLQFEYPDIQDRIEYKGVLNADNEHRLTLSEFVHTVSTPAMFMSSIDRDSSIKVFVVKSDGSMIGGFYTVNISVGSVAVMYVASLEEDRKQSVAYREIFSPPTDTHNWQVGDDVSMNGTTWTYSSGLTGSLFLIFLIFWPLISLLILTKGIK